MLSKLLTIKELTAWVEFKEGFHFHMRYLSRSKLQEITQSCSYMKYDPVREGRFMTVDGARLTEAYCAAAVIDWKGFTPNSVIKLLPLDLSAVPVSERDNPIPFSQEELLVVVKNAYDVDKFLQDVGPDIKMFKPEQDAEVKNSDASQSGS